MRIDAFKVRTPRVDPYVPWIGGFPALTGADTARDADPDGDGVANVIEFVTGSLPDDAASVFPVEVEFPNPDEVEFIYRSVPGSEVLGTRFELSTDLSNWSEAREGTGDVLIARAPIDGETDEVRVNVLLGTSGQRFGRIEVPTP